MGVWIFSRLVAIGQIDTVISILYFALLTGIGLSMLIESSKVIRDRIRRKSVKRKIHYHNWAHRLPFKVRFYKSKLYISVIPPIIIGFVIGILSATMGIGGAFILIPAMIYFLGMPASKVIGTSLFQIIFITALVTILHATTTFAVDAVLAFFLILFVIFIYIVWFGYSVKVENQKEQGDKVSINPYDQIPLRRRLIDKKNSKVGIFDLGNHILIAGVILLVIFVSLNVE